MTKLVRRIDLAQAGRDDARELLSREWLVTNGLGGYASGTISGTVSRRYHGLLIASLPAPLGRVVMLNHVAEWLRLPDGRAVQIGGEDALHVEEQGIDRHYVTEFRLENMIPFWRFEVEGVIVEKRLLLLHGQNTVHVTYSLHSSQAVRLELRPSVHFRMHENDVSEPLKSDYLLSIQGGRYEVSCGEPFPPLRLAIHGEAATFSVPFPLGGARFGNARTSQRRSLWKLRPTWKVKSISRDARKRQNFSHDLTRPSVGAKATAPMSQ
jgi:hypothetical protein